MIRIRSLALLASVGLFVPALAFATAFSAADETKVTLEGTHLCCGACVKAVDAAAATVEGAVVTCDRDAGAIAIVAPDVKTAQKAIDAISDAGYHGTPDVDTVKVKEDSGVEEGTVKTLALTGAHNCCGGCKNAITEALDSVGGIEEVKAEPRTTTVELTGEFDAQAVIAALNEAGFHVKVKKD